MQDVRYRVQVEDPVFKREWMNGWMIPESVPCALSLRQKGECSG